MNNIKTFAIFSLVMGTLSGISLSTHAEDATCFEINEAFTNPTTLNTLNTEFGFPLTGQLREPENTLTIDGFDFDKLKNGEDGIKKLGKNNCDIQLKSTVTKVKNGKTKFTKTGRWVYSFETGKSNDQRLCFRFKNEKLDGESAKKIIPVDFCVAR